MCVVEFGGPVPGRRKAQIGLEVYIQYYTMKPKAAQPLECTEQLREERTNKMNSNWNINPIKKKRSSKQQLCTRPGKMPKDELVTSPMLMGFFKAQLYYSSRRRRKQKLEKKKMNLSETLKKKQKKNMAMKVLDNHMYSTSPFLLRHNPKMIKTTYDELMMINNQPSTISDLPVDLLAQVLKRLPVKYVLRSRCVQKSWYFLIKTPYFITLHTNHQNENIHNRPKYLFFNAAYSHLMTIRFDDPQCHEYCRIRFLPDLPPSTWVAQSHGLFCITYIYEPENQDIHLWNPLVQKYRTLPDSPISEIFDSLCLFALAFGFVPHLNDYVVVSLIQPHPDCRPPNRHLVKIAVYSLNNNSWKTISQDYFFKGTIQMNHSHLVNGVAFWLGSKPKDRRILVCFDTKTDTLREILLPEILLPDWVETPLLGFHPFGQSIAYFVQDDESRRFDMWVLKGDSINEFFWEKKMSVDLSERVYFRVEVLGLRNNGEPIVFSLYDFNSYNLDNHEANDFVHSWDRWDDFSFYEYGMAPPFSISPFMESLALLNLE